MQYRTLIVVASISVLGLALPQAPMANRGSSGAAHEIPSLYRGELRKAGIGTDVGSLVAALGHKSGVIRMIAAEEMGKQRIMSAPPMLKGLLADPFDRVRLRAAESLLLLGDSSGLPVLRAQLTSTDKDDVAVAARILSANGDDSGLDKVRSMLTSKDRNERCWAFMAFEASHNPQEAYPALRLAADDEDRGIRLIAFNALEKRPTPETAGILAAVLQSRHKDDHGIAAGLLIRIRRVEAVPVLIEALTNDNPGVRRTAAVGLTYLAGRAITPRAKSRVVKLEDARLVRAEWQRWWGENKATFALGPPTPPKFADE